MMLLMRAIIKASRRCVDPTPPHAASNFEVGCRQDTDTMDVHVHHADVFAAMYGMWGQHS